MLCAARPASTYLSCFKNDFSAFNLKMSCAACFTTIAGGDEYLRCSLELCSQMYHSLCTGGRKSSESADSWVCPACRCATKKGGDNSLTPVGASKKSRDPNVTFRKKVPTVNLEEMHEIKSIDFSTEICSMRLEMSKLKDQLSTAVTIIMSYETKLECYAAHVQALHEKLNQFQIAQVSINTIPEQSRTAAVSQERVSPSIPKNKNQKHLSNVPPETSSPPTASYTSAALPVPSGSASDASGSSHMDSSHLHQAISTPRPAPALDKQQEWTEVKRKSRRPPSLCGTAGPSVTTLKAVEACSYIHLWNMASNAEEVTEYLRQLCPAGTCTVEELSPRGNYKSYKIGVPVTLNDMCLSTDIWPINARIKAWINYPKPLRPRKPMQKKQPFRGATTSE